MKKLSTSLLLMLIAIFSYSQSVVFHENFELLSLDDSVTSTAKIPGISDWGICENLSATGSRSDSCTVDTLVSTYLTTIPFYTVGADSVFLRFNHICKVHFLDVATLEISVDNGISWTQLTKDYYRGSANFATNGDRFASNSYGNSWVPASNTAVPDNSWWRLEEFDISSFMVDSLNTLIRFNLMDGGVPGPNDNYGWIIDDIRVVQYPLIGQTIGTRDIEDADELIHIWPNPVESTLYIDSPDISFDNIKIFSLDGRVLKDLKIPGDKARLQIDLSGLKPGTYILQLHEDASNVFTKRIIVY